MTYMTDQQIQEQIPALRVAVAELQAVQMAWLEAPGAAEHFDAAVSHISKALERVLATGRARR